jgi:hypothetical protein
MTSPIDDPVPALLEYYSYTTHANAAAAFSANAGHSTGQTNAFAHAYVSAMIALEHSAVEAKVLGDGREARTTFDFYFRGGADYRVDTYKDLYNDAIGREIGKYADANDLTSTDAKLLPKTSQCCLLSAVTISLLATNEVNQ